MLYRRFFCGLFCFILSCIGIDSHCEVVGTLSPYYCSSCDTQSAAVLDRLAQIPEGRVLLERVRKAGRIHIERVSCGCDSAAAFWDGARRTIALNRDHGSEFGRVVISIVFELHNAATTKQLEAICRDGASGELDKDGYVEAIERLEHGNMLAADRLLEQGINLGLFPQSASWCVMADFDDYYMMQQLMGHSQWIAKQYDTYMRSRPYTPFRGTIKGLGQLSARDKDSLSNILMAKVQAKEGTRYERAGATQYLSERFARARGVEGQHERRLLHTIFGPQSEWEELHLHRPVYTRRNHKQSQHSS